MEIKKKELEKLSIDEIISSAERAKHVDCFEVRIEWDRNDADYLQETLIVPRDGWYLDLLGFWATFPNCKRYIENNVSEEFYDYLCEFDIIIYDSESGNPCHSIGEISITYLSPDGILFDIPLEKFKVNNITKAEFEKYLIEDEEAE